MSHFIEPTLQHVLLTGVGAGAVVLVALVLRLMVRRDAVLRYQIMVSALLAGAAMLPLQLLISEATTRTPSSAAAWAPLVAASPSAEHARTSSPMPLASHETPIAAASVPVSTVATINIAAVLLAAYLFGASCVFLSHLRGLLAARRTLLGCQPVTDPRVLSIWSALIADHRRPPRLLECDSLHAPACCVLGRATVILPKTVGEIDDEALTATLRHELVHVARRDGLVVLIASIATAAVWFQPLVWIFVRILGADREQSCDAIVVRTTGKPRTYARALLWFCDQNALPQHPAGVIGFESAHSVRRRVLMLSHALQPTHRSHRLVIVLASLAGFAAALSAHGQLAAAVGPGPILPDTSATSTDAAKPEASSLKVSEIRASADGRSPIDVYQRAEKVHRRNLPGGQILDQAPKDGSWAFFIPERLNGNFYPLGTWATDEESILSIKDARIESDSIRGNLAKIRLPGGSKLRATFEGRDIKVERLSDQTDRVTVTGGVVRVVDDGGVTRLEIRGESHDAVLTWSSVLEEGERVFHLTASGASTAIVAKTDARTGTPAGEVQPPHESVRWKQLSSPATGAAFVELRMQWFYDLGAMRQPDGC